MRRGERSAWHRVDATENWLYHAGAPLELVVVDPTGNPPGEPVRLTLGTGFAAGHTAHGVVPPGAWQSAISLGAWTLVGCVVAPAFSFAGFELAPPGWEPAAGDG